MSQVQSPQKDILVDIAIPVYNEERTIKQCLDSVLCFKKDENVLVTIFIIDGGSNDKTFSMIKILKYSTTLKKFNLAP